MHYRSLDGTLCVADSFRTSLESARAFGKSVDECTALLWRGARVLGGGALCKRVYSFVWSATFKVLISCGCERTIPLRNPYGGGGAPLTALQGHTASVVALAVNDDDGQLVSCSVDKQIKVWDLRTYRVMQSLEDKV